MALHVTSARKFWDGVTLTQTTDSATIPVGSHIEGRVFLDADVSAGTWTPKIQQQDPKTGQWFDRGDISMSAFTTTGGPLGDGQNQKQMVTIDNLGSRIRVSITPAGATPSIVINGVYEGKT